MSEIEWLDPEPIPRAKHRPFTRIPQREGEHAVETIQATGTPRPIGREDDFRIGFRSKSMALGLKLAPQLGRVVDLAVVRDPQQPILGPHRLPPERREVHDREPAMPESNRELIPIGTDGLRQGSDDGDRFFLRAKREENVPLAIRPAMRLDAGHRLEQTKVHGSGRREYAGDAAHYARPRYAWIVRSASAAGS